MYGPESADAALSRLGPFGHGHFAGEAHVKGRPLVGRAGYADGRFVAADDPGYGREPQSSSRKLGGEEWLEDARFGFRIHAASGIGHFEKNAAFRVEAGFNHDRAGFLADGLRGVIHQVQYDLRHLVRIGFDERQIGSELQPQSDFLRYGGFDQLAVAPYQSGKLHFLHEVARLAGIGQQLPRQVGGAMAGMHHIPQAFAEVALRRQLAQYQAGVSHDAGEQVVEVVRHPGRQRAYGFEFLRVAELLLQLPVRSHVTHHVDGARGDSRVVEYGVHGHV